MGIHNLRPWNIQDIAVVVAISVLAAACAGAAPATPVPTAQVTTGEATPTSAPVATAGPAPTPTVTPAVTPMSPSVVSAKESITLVVGKEPQNLNSHLTIGGSVYASITRPIW